MMFPSVLRDTHLLPGRRETEMGSQAKPSIWHPFKPIWFKYLFYIYFSEAPSGKTAWRVYLLSNVSSCCLADSVLTSDLQTCPRKTKVLPLTDTPSGRQSEHAFHISLLTPNSSSSLSSVHMEHSPSKVRKMQCPHLLISAVSELAALNLAAPANASCLIIQAWAQFGWKMANDLHPSLLPAVANMCWGDVCSWGVTRAWAVGRRPYPCSSAPWACSSDPVPAMMSDLWMIAFSWGHTKRDKVKASVCVPALCSHCTHPIEFCHLDFFPKCLIPLFLLSHQQQTRCYWWKA